MDLVLGSGVGRRLVARREGEDQWNDQIPENQFGQALPSNDHRSKVLSQGSGVGRRLVALRDREIKR
jgi:hypothetical protein